MKEFKIRASQIGKIMTNPISKSETLSKTTISYLQEWLKEQLYGRKKEFQSKYTDKGNIMEDNSIDFIAEQLEYGFLVKNEQHFENDYMTGTPDLILKDLIIDVKNSWDCFTFPLFDTEIPNKDYYWQLQGYMSLTGKNHAKLIYVLSDTPENLIEREAYYYCKNNGYDELDADIYDQFIEKMTYNGISAMLKYKVFDVERNQEDIDKIKKRVVDCKEYIRNLVNEL